MKVTGLSWKQLFVIMYWLIFKYYKVKALYYYETKKGMYDLFAFERVSRMTKQECRKFNSEQNVQEGDATGLNQGDADGKQTTNQ